MDHLVREIDDYKNTIKASLVGAFWKEDAFFQLYLGVQQVGDGAFHQTLACLEIGMMMTWHVLAQPYWHHMQVTLLYRPFVYAATLSLKMCPWF